MVLGQKENKLNDCEFGMTLESKENKWIESQAGWNGMIMVL